MADTQQTIQNLIKSLTVQRDRRPAEGEPKPLVALSRGHGAGGRELAEWLAHRLEVPLYDKTIVDAVAKDARVSKTAFDHLDDRLRRRGMEWLYTLLSGENASVDAYRRHLVNVLLAIERSGGVILGRGAHVFLSSHPIFRVRIIGSEKFCARRLGARKGMEEAAALEEVRRVDREREAFLHAMFHKRVDTPEYFDLVVNTDRFADLAAVGDLLLRSMAAHGHSAAVGIQTR